MIRIAGREDIPAILDIYAPYILTTTASFEYEVPTLADFSRRFDSYTAQFPWLVWEEEGRILGYAYASPPYSRAAYRWCAEPSVYLRPEARGRGIGTRLYRALEKILELQGYQVLYALITGENTASLAFHRARGYTVRVEFPACGFKFGRWLSLFWLEKRLKSVENPQCFPEPWENIVHNAYKMADILSILSLS